MVNKIYKHLDMNSMSIKNTKWNFGNIYKISSENKTFWNQETNTNNQETFLYFQLSGIPSTPQHFDSHPCIRPPISLEKSREGSGNRFLTMIVKNGKLHELHTCILIEVSPVDRHVNFATNRTLLICMIFRVGERMKPCLRFA